MKINHVGFNYSHKDDFRMIRPEGAESNVFIHVRSNASFELGGKLRHVAPGSVIFYKKGTAQNYGSDGERYTDDWISFEASDEEIKALEIEFDKILILDDASTVSYMIEKMYHEKFSGNSNRQRKLKLYFELLCLEISDKTKMHTETDKHQTTMYSIRAEIYNKPAVKWTNNWLATLAHMSESYFQYLYKKTFNISPIEDVIQSRMERAKYLLRNTNLRVTQIASELGYKNDVQFMSQFKKSVGITPTDYRKKHRI